MNRGEMTHRRGRPGHPPTLLLAGLITQVAAAWLPDPLPDLPAGGRALGGASLVLGVALNIAATRGFDRVGTPVRPMSPPRALVTDGVYRITRNPMYLGLALILAGSALALSSVWAALVVLPFVLAMDRLIRREEAFLEDVFGDSYRAYRANVRRWL